MFDPDFYPTPPSVIEKLADGLDIENMIILEPSAGTGNIVRWLQEHGAKQVIACERHPELRQIVSNLCKVITPDFFDVKAEQVSHCNVIIMNPPFSADEKHIAHAWEIAPEGCEIRAICNANTIHKPFSEGRKRLLSLIGDYGSYNDLGDAFSDAERKTYVDVSLVKLTKPGGYQTEFEGFFMGEDEEEKTGPGIMPYNFVRDLVNRYVEAVKIFDRQLETAIRMSQLTEGFYTSNLAMSVTEEGRPKTRNEFKKDLQKSAWMYIFQKMKMDKFVTKGLKSEINSFVEKQTNVPFTMRNIYRMLEIIIGTHDERMDKALLEVFDRLTQHYHDNRYHVEGWKTNSHYLINQKFIIPWMTDRGWNGYFHISWGQRNTEVIEDMQKALCWLTGKNYDNYVPLDQFINRTPEEGQQDHWNQQYKKRQWNTWYTWEPFFEVKGFKKGTCHFRFKDQDVWAKFNQRIAKIKGYPLPEKYQKAS